MVYETLQINRLVRKNAKFGLNIYIYYSMETLGTNYGGWSIPINTSLNKDSVIYSGGVGEDISFDLR